MHLIALGIVFPAMKDKDPVIIMPNIVKTVVDQHNTLEYMRKIRVNTEIIELTTALSRVYGLLKLDKLVVLLDKYIEYKSFTKEELMKFTDDNWIVNDKCAKKMKNFLNNTFYIDEEQINLLIEKAYDDAQNGDLDNTYKEIREGYEVGEVVEEYINVIRKFANNIPIWTLKGKTINEMSREKYNDKYIN